MKATAHCQDSPQRGSGSVCARTRPAPAERRRVNESGPNIDRVSILPPPSLPSSLHPRTANVAARQRTARPRQGTRPLLFVSRSSREAVPAVPAPDTISLIIIMDQDHHTAAKWAAECWYCWVSPQLRLSVIFFMFNVVFGSASVRRGEPNNLLLIQKIPGIFGVAVVCLSLLRVVVFAVTAELQVY